MLITIEYYAKMYNKTKLTILNGCNRGKFLTAKKVGRNWFIDEHEPFSDNRSPMTKFEPIEVDAPKITKNYIPLTEYAKEKNFLYKTLQQAAIDERLPTARKIGNQWFIDKNTVYILSNTRKVD